MDASEGAGNSGSHLIPHWVPREAKRRQTQQRRERTQGTDWEATREGRRGGELTGSSPGEGGERRETVENQRKRMSAPLFWRKARYRIWSGFNTGLLVLARNKATGIKVRVDVVRGHQPPFKHQHHYALLQVFRCRSLRRRCERRCHRSVSPPSLR
jgi:hypothetical protein